MKKLVLMMMLAGSVSVMEACNSGSSSKDAVDSVRNPNLYEVSNKDTSKTVTTTGGATLMDYSSSGGTRMPKGKPSARTTMMPLLLQQPRLQRRQIQLKKIPLKNKVNKKAFPKIGKAFLFA
jgi:hypothetical protein